MREVLAGIRNALGTRKDRKAPAHADALAAMLATITGDDLRALRDRAVPATGMAAALRRSELVALWIEDVELSPEGLRLLISRSKTDQSGEGAVIGVPEGRRIRPQALLLAWTEAATAKAQTLSNPFITFETGPLFRRLTRRGELTAHPMSDKAATRLVKHSASDAGFNPGEFAGHSLRSGVPHRSGQTGCQHF